MFAASAKARGCLNNDEESVGRRLVHHRLVLYGLVDVQRRCERRARSLRARRRRLAHVARQRETLEHRVERGKQLLDVVADARERLLQAPAAASAGRCRRALRLERGIGALEQRAQLLLQLALSAAHNHFAHLFEHSAREALEARRLESDKAFEHLEKYIEGIIGITLNKYKYSYDYEHRTVQTSSVMAPNSSEYCSMFQLSRSAKFVISTGD